MLGTDEKFWRVLSILIPYDFRIREELSLYGKARFVHYTSAAVAASIICKKEVWMRKSSMMNDFREIDYGHDLLSFALKNKCGDLFKKNFEKISPGLFEEVIHLFDQWMPIFINDTYLTCLSKHEHHEDELGRLSMWRAYGGSTGIALVLNSTPFAAETDRLGAHSNPVFMQQKIDTSNIFIK